MTLHNLSNVPTAHERDELHFDNAFPADDGGNAAASHSYEGHDTAARSRGNGSANGTARRNVLNEAATLINAGGLGHAQASNHSTATDPGPGPPTSEEISSALRAYERAFLPNQPKSLSGISLRAFLLGLVLSLSSTLSVYLAYNGHTVWRAPFFIASLCVFHFLEFYTTALTNTASARVSSFLLSSNGSAYTIAHTAAFVECILIHLFWPFSFLPSSLHTMILTSGILLIILGQTIRAIAMIQAGRNFSHLVAHTKRSEHQLVTSGLYSVLRHPSYFGYFWWAIGTQLACGNAVCLVGYAGVLWLFFARRIVGEEELLIKFFGQEYVGFRERTWVGIPGIK
ncbi:Protein-S-isoprenylcysteine O-methyltransferase [Lachnellula hyalina]|uniref:Protein-S-isoprenylcysteine O-methyltransferase n=1 Tax=Lachnellula hyalina TaxID=1316788 RepID=A0A8H8RCB1_9HELO|nr:Protein-S-isoprenylcysteine O-methyltransferase [Lachnellula hyalina]TVY30742.1 Protein-S-isoprenylcysteine O-methyltransferase [Lachnellula hyalina]